MQRVISIGIQGFEKIRTENYFYVDKTGFIKEWWETGADVTLITRPRRFGKTLNMDMLNCFSQIVTRTGAICLKDCLSGKKRNITVYRGHIRLYS